MTSEVYGNGRHVHIAIEGIEGIILACLMSVLIGNVGIQPLVAIAKTAGGDVGIGKGHVVKTCGVCQGIV